MGTEDPKELLGGLPETQDELLAHAGSLDEQGRTDEAIRLLEKACLRSPSTPLRKSLAAFYRKDERLDDCLAILDDVLSRHPDDIPTIQLLAEAQIEAGDLGGARASRARLKELGVSRTGLLRLSLKLKKAKQADSGDGSDSTNETSGDEEEAESESDGPPPLPIPKPANRAPDEVAASDDALEEESDTEDSSGLDVDDDALSSFFESPVPDEELEIEELDELEPEAGDELSDGAEVIEESEADDSGVEEGEGEARPHEFYVGPTRVASLSNPDEEIDGAPAIQSRPADLRQSISDLFARDPAPLSGDEGKTVEEQPAEPEQPGFELEEVEESDEGETKTESPGEISLDRSAKLRKRSARGTLMGLPTAPNDGGDEESEASEDSQDSFFADFEREEAAADDDKPEYMQTLGFAGVEASEVVEDSEPSESPEPSEPRVEEVDEVEAEGLDEPSFFSEFEDRERQEASLDAESVKEQAEDASTADHDSTPTDAQESEEPPLAETAERDAAASDARALEVDDAGEATVEDLGDLDWEPTTEFDTDDAEASATIEEPDDHERFESGQTTEYNPDAESDSGAFDELDYEPTTEIGDQFDSEELDELDYEPTTEIGSNFDSDELDELDYEPTTEIGDQFDSEELDELDYEQTTEFESNDSGSLTDLIESVEAEKKSARAAADEAESEKSEDSGERSNSAGGEESGEQWFAEEGEDPTERSIADASEEDIWRDRIEESQDIDATMSVRRKRKSLWTALLVILVLLVAGAAGAGWYAMKSLADEHERILVEAKKQRAPDTYQGYLKSVDTLERMSDATSFAGPEVDKYLADFGLTSDRVATSREDAATQLALLNAMIEFRYEKMDSRDSDEHIERAEQVAGDRPEIATARAYRLMAGGERQKAREALSKARLDYSRSRDLAAASIELEIASGRAHAADHAAGLLRDTTKDRVYFDYLLGRIDLAKEDSTAEDVFRGILERSSPDHLSARISQSYAVRLGESTAEDRKEARELVEPILNGMGERASQLQKAKAHVALGHTYMAEEAYDKAGPHFEKAVELSPTRAGLQNELVEYYVVTEQSEKALEQVEIAVEKVGQTDSLSQLEAEALYQLRRCDDVIQVLEKISEPSHASKFLTGQCLLEIGEPGEAMKAFQAAAKLDENTPIRAKAYEMVAQARSTAEPEDSWLPVMDSLVEKAENSPELLRAKALLLLEFGEDESGLREQREFFRDAISTLQEATKKRENWRLAEYDLCRAYLRLGDEEPAVTHCEKGRELDPLYRPGMTTAIELAVFRGESEAAGKMAAELAEHFPDAPDVRLARVRAMVAQSDIEQAETLNEGWATGGNAPKAKAALARGLVAFEREDYPGASAQFEVAHKASPHDVESAVRYAWALAMQGDDAGEEILRNRLSDPLWGARAWQGLGELRLRQERYNSARQNFAEALDKYRDTIAPLWRQSESYAGLARAWANLQGWDHYMTRRYVSRASSKADADSVAARYLSGVYHRRKRRSDLDKAAQRFEYVIERKPYHCSSLDYLRDIYKRKNADEDLERVDKLATKYCKESG